MRLIPIAVALVVTWASAAIAQVQPGCQEVPGGGMQCSLLHTFNNGILLQLQTVATLPTCNTAAKGQIRAVSDATAPTYNGALTGGGAVTVPVICSGTAWLSH